MTPIYKNVYVGKRQASKTADASEWDIHVDEKGNVYRFEEWSYRAHAYKHRYGTTRAWRMIDNKPRVEAAIMAMWNDEAAHNELWLAAINHRLAMKRDSLKRIKQELKQRKETPLGYKHRKALVAEIKQLEGELSLYS